MNSKQRRQHQRQLERLYGAQLTLDIATARLIGQTHIFIPTRLPNVWGIDYAVSHRYETLKAIAFYDKAHRIRPSATVA